MAGSRRVNPGDTRASHHTRAPGNFAENASASITLLRRGLERSTSCAESDFSL